MASYSAARATLPPQLRRSLVAAVSRAAHVVARAVDAGAVSAELLPQLAPSLVAMAREVGGAGGGSAAADAVRGALASMAAACEGGGGGSNEGGSDSGSGKGDDVGGSVGDGVSGGSGGTWPSSASGMARLLLAMRDGGFDPGASFVSAHARQLRRLVLNADNNVGSVGHGAGIGGGGGDSGGAVGRQAARHARQRRRGSAHARGWVEEACRNGSLDITPFDAGSLQQAYRWFAVLHAEHDGR
eukprot:354803-Chlamydomonas_euryale.AAC.6